MSLLNKNYLKLKSGYLFPEIQRRAQLFADNHSNISLLNLGIGDITEPLAPTVAKAICEATQEMQNKARGYGPSSGYNFLKEKICQNDFASLPINPDEIFISDGTKCDIAAMQELFTTNNQVAICDPVYPVYVDSNIMAGRGKKICYLPCTEKNNFLPQIPSQACSLIYLCSPNNPTGTAFSKKELQKWVEYAQAKSAIIFFDAAYEAFITDPDLPHSIYEIKGADSVAIEFRSFSKTAGFTGLRCSYYVVPKKIKVEGTVLHSLWTRRVDTKFGGVSYPIQRGAETIYSPAGRQEIKQTITSYMNRTFFFKKELQKLGYTVFGGQNAPYLWVKTSPTYSSWQFFDHLLTKGIVSTPGEGFGPSGNGFIRFSCFAPLTVLQEAVLRLKTT